MKLPIPIQRLFQPKIEPQPEPFLSLVLDSDAVLGAVWQTAPKKISIVQHVSLQPLVADSWDDRVAASDKIIGKLEEKIVPAKLRKVVLGLPSHYLTDDGNIAPKVRGYIKKLTQVLKLVPLGFVPLHEAIIHAYKLEEGIPPNAILLGVSGKHLILYLYKIGKLIGKRNIDVDANLVVGIEEALRSFTEVEVLPSRVFLYGMSFRHLEEYMGELMRHPWQTRANFLHFPKIEALSVEFLATAVCRAGASELALTLGEDDAEDAPRLTDLPSPPTEDVKSIPVDEDELEASAQSGGSEEDANVTVVDPELLGFHKNMSVARDPTESATHESTEVESRDENRPRKPRFAFSLPMPHIRLPRIRSFPLPRMGLRLLLLILLIVLAISGCAWFLYWKLPAVAMTVYQVPQTLQAGETVTIQTSATIADGTSKILPGKIQEKTVSGEKTIPITGKKKVGDPARGAVTIYNKSLSTRTFKKGAVLTSGSLQFTIDTDVSVASASENLAESSLTYGKSIGNITAGAIGVQGNLPGGTEFAFKDIDDTIAIGRNDQPLTGGTSRDATVVTRADYDALIRVLTQELVEKAKQELSGTVTGGEKLIDETIKTAVTKKTFVQELDQEATDLTGAITLSVSGVSYAEADVAGVLKDFLKDNVPSGFAVDDSRTKVALGEVKIKKDGTITSSASLTAVAVPVLDAEAMRRDLAGKPLDFARDYLQKISGVGGVTFDFRFTPGKNRLPINKNNISITLALQE
ncbi:MAG: hypothetical protein Q7S76_02725 [bacterium]|nr:hypothetical protein [bacterium]